MKKDIIYFVVLISLNSCFVLPLAPRTDYYKPIGGYKKILYKNFKNMTLLQNLCKFKIRD